jgi:putative transposase
MQNGICEAFNGRMRDERLNETVCYNLDHARAALDRRIKRRRPHSAI